VLTQSQSTPVATELQDAVLEARGVSKWYGPVRVVSEVNFTLGAGEIHAIIGENGAGKSTLARMLSGIVRPDAGTIEHRGAPIAMASPLDARRHGIGIIHQEPTLFPSLDIAANVFAGRELKRGPGAAVMDWPRMYRETERLLTAIGQRMDPRTLVRGLSVAERQMVDMVSALADKPTALIVDEPTASLTPSEVDDLFRVLRDLRGHGVGIVFIGHRLEEVLSISDRITVMRDSRVIQTLPAAGATEDQLVRLMVGREASSLYTRQRVQPGAPVLAVEGLARKSEFSEIGFEIRAGEIVGLGGLVGAGRTEVAETIFGVRRADHGVVRIDGQAVHIRSSRDAIRQGIAYVPEDRQQHGLLLPVSIAQNIALPRLRQLSRYGILRPAAERAQAVEYTRPLHLVARSVLQAPRELSGGNQQKVVFAKWLTTAPRVLILDEPTRGVDVGAKAEIHRIMGDLAKRGVAILMISSDLPELLTVSDRVLVMREGRIVSSFTRETATPEAVIAAASLERSNGKKSP
jgi:rhamnose transport system ATP-binding protein